MTIDRANYDKPIIHIVDEACERYCDRVCLQYGEETYTYGEVQALSIQYASALQGAGFQQGMHAAIYSLNSAKAFVLTLAIIRAGGVWIPVNPRNSVADNIKVLNKLGCDAIFYQREFVDVIEGIKPAHGHMLVSEDIDQVEAWLDGAKQVTVCRKDDVDNIITMPMTGGTTGVPKGVMLSDLNFRALSYAMAYVMRNWKRDPVYMVAAPMTHVGGRIVLATMSTGCRFVILDKVDPQEILHTIEREGITDFFLPPTAIYSLLAQPNVRDFDFSSLEAITYGSAPISEVKLREAIDVFGPVMTGGFGQTECPMMISNFPREDHIIDGKPAEDGRLRSVGKASVISELAILDDDANELPLGELGEIGVKGDMVSPGYFNAPEESAKIRKNGWHLTGDIGYLNDDGFLFIVDRKKDMIITGGFNVYSSEVENALSSIKGVAQAAVIGVPSEHWGEEVKAFICLEEGRVLPEADIIAQCKADIGSVKSPKSIDFVDVLPTTPLGKVDKKQLKARYA
ncbi:AMP-binding protein [Maricurvus nonylphenolicus]|uniref:class I adenylate-forming enzyme family protein n=1 Tax=Maricurvus nonylphenolicus TaxID=1008307 RepID=UPI0036F3ADE8